MASLTFEQLDDVIVFRVSGAVTAEEILDAIKNTYHLITCHVIWDFSEASLSEITQDQFIRVLASAKKYRPYNKSGKTAYVSTSVHNYGMTRMFSTMAEVAGLPYPYKAFKSFDASIEWLRL